jgi:hypothetical protein
VNRSSRPLQLALLANAAFSTVTGLAVLVFARPLAVTLGVDPAWLLPALGVGLLLFALDLVRTARRPTPRYALWISALDFAWVLGSALLLAVAPHELTTVGRWVVAAVALFVASFGVAQVRGVARLCGPTPRRDDGTLRGVA